MAATTITIDKPSAPQADLRLLRLMQLVSPTLPVGAFAYSQGLEWAIEAGWVSNARQVGKWIGGALHNGQSRLDVPVLARLYQARQKGDVAGFAYWNQFLSASRGSSELQNEDLHMGRALHRLLSSLMPESKEEMNCPDPTYTAMFAVTAVHWGIDLESACTGLLWAWCENQVAAAIKLVPLGQTQGQTLLMELAGQIPSAVKDGLALTDDAIGAVTPALTLASAKHETQHTRLFRS